MRRFHLVVSLGNKMGAPLLPRSRRFFHRKNVFQSGASGGTKCRPFRFHEFSGRTRLSGRAFFQCRESLSHRRASSFPVTRLSGTDGQTGFSALLLFVEHHNVVNVLAFGILTPPRGRPRLPVFRHCAGNGHHYFAVFLLHGFNSVCIDPPYRN